MRTTADFNEFYQAIDPWKLAKARSRDRIYKRLLAPFIRDQHVLELGCGEGHLTRTVFGSARAITGIDISDIAIARAKSDPPSNAEFRCSNFLKISYEGFDVICAIECLNYLAIDERGLFFEKLCKQHKGKIFAFSNPIIGGRYFLHVDLMEVFRKFNLRLLSFHNLNVYWKPAHYRVVANIVKLPPFDRTLDLLPDRFIYQRLYVLEVPSI